jgi:membrane associated rhomboid family serine protease
VNPSRHGTVLLLFALFAAYALELARGAPTHADALYALGALPDAGSLQGQWWRVLSYGFLHWNALHLVANAALLAWIGSVVERRLGARVLWSVFVSAVVAGGLACVVMRAWWPKPGVSVGASAGAFALLALAAGLLWRDARAPRAAKVAVALVLGLGIAVSFLPGISLLGHLTGLLVGLGAYSMFAGAQSPVTISPVSTLRREAVVGAPSQARTASK